MKRRRKALGFSLVELLVVIAIILIILAIAVPNIQRARLQAAETVVIREVQTIGQAQTQYLSQYGKYATTLTELGPPSAGGKEGPQAAYLIPGSLASGEKNGYLFTMSVTATGYAVHADPKVFGGTGRRTFYLDQNGIVHQNLGQEPASESSSEIK
jgi:type IV pilus assembly protein PilA